ncbi:MAG: peptidoglycan-associated lipoprotein Pal [Alphaproteobacteria bacterium]|nr:peptidoglycan-associated lipoprotein Pal [Alphaproteobacteria bacterium]
MTRFSARLRLATIALAVVLTGCETKPAPTTPAAPVASLPTPAAASIVPGSAEDLRVNVGDTVHFDYNKSAILEADKPTLQRQATWLEKYSTVRVTIQGNCDERGTREYNLALGARRAAAVKEYLVSLGVSTARIDTISYGKERPICSESTEACWAQNRRAATAITSGASS